MDSRLKLPSWAVNNIGWMQRVIADNFAEIPQTDRWRRLLPQAKRSVWDIRDRNGCLRHVRFTPTSSKCRRACKRYSFGSSFVVE
jgi:hypothetical protein